jgi:hypothetical protein
VTWYYEEAHVAAKGTSKLLATIPVGEVVDMDKMLEILRDIPIQQGDVEWNCVSWMKMAVDELSHDGTALEIHDLGKDWQSLRDSAIWAADQKANQYQDAAAR